MNPLRNPEAILMNLAGHIQFALGSGNTDTESFNEQGEKFKVTLKKHSNGNTKRLYRFKTMEERKHSPNSSSKFTFSGIMITLSRHLLTPLLHADLTEAEVLVQQMEMSHVVSRYLIEFTQASILTCL